MPCCWGKGRPDLYAACEMVLDAATEDGHELSDRRILQHIDWDMLRRRRPRHRSRGRGWDERQGTVTNRSDNRKGTDSRSLGGTTIPFAAEERRHCRPFIDPGDGARAPSRRSVAGPDQIFPQRTPPGDVLWKPGMEVGQVPVSPAQCNPRGADNPLPSPQCRTRGLRRKRLRPPPFFVIRDARTLRAVGC